MTALDDNIKIMNEALQKIVRWPYVKERDEVLDYLGNYHLDIVM